LTCVLYLWLIILDPGDRLRESQDQTDSVF
jgi:hypothetical protein